MAKKIEIEDERSAHLVEAFEAMTEPAKQMALALVEDIAVENLRPASAPSVPVLRMHGNLEERRVRVVKRRGRARYAMNWDALVNAALQLPLPGMTPVL